MSFLLLPTGAPARIVAGHPRHGAISDALGGAIPAPLDLPSAQCAVWVRESGASEGLDRNIVASVLCATLGAGPMAVLGPAVLTTILWQPDGSGVAECIPENAIQDLRGVMDDIQRALAGHDHGFTHPRLEQDGWPARARRVAEMARVAPIPDGYPGGDNDDGDPVSGLLRKAGLGHRFVPVQPH